MTRILGVDPGRTDPFASVLIQVKDKKIYILGAKFWKNQERYQLVYDEISRIVKQQDVSYVIVEKNSAGDPIIDALKYEYRLPVRAVFTTNTKSREAKKGIMNKSEMVTWLFQNHNILDWPRQGDEYLLELKKQWTVFGEYHKNKFEAPSGTHDDLMMALMLACYFARLNFIRDPTNKFVWLQGSELQGDPITALNKEYEEGKTGLHWTRVT
ncbi:MAG: hypothetical protein FJ360_03615 [Thaumarchaeota archaeon]|nr:hypothetical protein [Nitrososphaerota archaeon]